MRAALAERALTSAASDPDIWFVSAMDYPRLRGAAALVAAPWIVTWPLLLHTYSPDLFRVWLDGETLTRLRGGVLYGGKQGLRDTFVGETTRYVVNKAHCRVLLTAPPGEG